MAKETSVKETTPAVPPPETKPSPPTTLFGKFYPTGPHVPPSLFTVPFPPNVFVRLFHMYREGGRQGSPPIKQI